MSCNIDLTDLSAHWVYEGRDVCQGNTQEPDLPFRDGQTAHITCSDPTPKRERDGEPKKLRFCASTSTLNRKPDLSLYTLRLGDTLSDDAWRAIQTHPGPGGGGGAAADLKIFVDESFIDPPELFRTNEYYLTFKRDSVARMIEQIEQQLDKSPLTKLDRQFWILRNREEPCTVTIEAADCEITVDETTIKRPVRLFEYVVDDIQSITTTLQTVLNKVGLDSWRKVQRHFDRVFKSGPRGLTEGGRRGQVVVRDGVFTIRISGLLRHFFGTPSFVRKKARVTFDLGIVDRMSDLANMTLACPIPFVTINRDGSCWADAAIFALLYPFTIRRVVMQLARTVNHPTLTQYLEQLSNLYATSIYNNDTRCPRIPPGRQLLTLIQNAMNAASFEPSLFTSPPLDGGFFTNSIWESLVDLQLLTQFESSYYIDSNEFKLDSGDGKSSGGFDQNGVYLLQSRYSVRSVDATIDQPLLPSVLVLKNQFENLEKFRHRSLLVKDSERPDSLPSTYELRSIVFKVNAGSHAVALASCDDLDVPLDQTRWVFFDAQSLRFFAHGTYDDLPRSVLTSDRDATKEWEVRYMDQTMNTFAEGNGGWMFFVKR